MANPKNNRPRREMDAAYEEVKKSQSKSDDFAPFLQAMKDLDEEMEELMVPDENGWKMLDKDRLSSLAEKYRMAGSYLEVYLYHTEKTTDPEELETREKAKKLSELLAADTSALRRYSLESDGQLKSLPTLIEEARIPVMDQGSKVIKSVGGAQSSRFPMTIIGPDGKPMAGIFTKADVFEPMEDYRKAVERAVAKSASPDGSALLTNFMAAYKAYYTQNPDEKKPVNSDPAMISRFLLSCRKPGAGSGDFKINTDRLTAEIAQVNNMTPAQVKNLCGKNAIKEMAARLSEISPAIYIKSLEVEMENGTRIDRKNAGMSTVAELLGVQDIICHSRPMKLKGPDGKIVDGTFMALAKGIDAANPGREGYGIGGSSLENTDGRGLEKIADLQVLDYICGNIDRHGANCFYQFDENGKLIGVQGIDNDSSFGKFIPKKSGDRTYRTLIPGAMGVISKKMADRVMKMTLPELAFSLRGTIDEPSIRAACERLFILKQYIQKSREKLDPNKQDIEYPYIRELDREGFKNADLNKLTDKRIDNHFCEFKKAISKISLGASASNVPLDPDEIGSGNRATEAGVFGQCLKGQQFSKMLSDRTSFWRGSSSQNYTDLEKAVKDYTDLQEMIYKRMQQMKQKVKKGSTSPEDAFGQYVTGFDMQKMRMSLKAMQAAADKYADEKTAELAAKGKTLDDDKYIKSRIEGAREISRFAAEGQKVSEEETKSLASNDRRSMEQLVRNKNAAEKRKKDEEANRINTNDKKQDGAAVNSVLSNG